MWGRERGKAEVSVGKLSQSARSKFWGCQGRKTEVAVTTVPNSLILGGWVTKVLKNGEKNRGKGWKGG